MAGPQGSGLAGISTLAASFDVAVNGALANRVAFAFIHRQQEIANPYDITGVTCGGQAMTKLVDLPSATSGSTYEGFTEVWVLVAPPNGATGVAVTLSTTPAYWEGSIACVWLDDARQEYLAGDVVTGTPNGVTATAVPVTTPSDNNYVLSFVGDARAGNGVTPTGGQTVLEDSQNVDASSAALYYELYGTDGQQSDSYTTGNTIIRGGHITVKVQPPKPTISSYTANPATIAAGGSSDLTVAYAPGTVGNTVTVSHAHTGGAAPATFTNTTLDTATMTGTSPGTQVTRTFTVTVTERDAGNNIVGTASAQVSVVESATANQKPTVNPTADQTTVEDGTVVSLHANAADPDGTVAAVAWTQPEPGLLSATNVTDPTFDTTGRAGESFTFDVQATDNDGATSTVESVTIDVVAANEPIGLPVTAIVTTTVPNGAATAQLKLRARQLDDGEFGYFDSFGILTGDLTEWVPGGIVDTGAIFLEYRDPVSWTDDGIAVYDADGWEPVRFGQGVTPDATGQAVILDHEIPHGAARQYRARVRAEL